MPKCAKLRWQFSPLLSPKQYKKAYSLSMLVYIILQQNWRNFTWSRVVSECQEEAPLLIHLVKSAMKGASDIRMGFVIALFFFSCRPARYTFVQNALSVILAGERASQDVGIIFTYTAPFRIKNFLIIFLSHCRFFTCSLLWVLPKC